MFLNDDWEFNVLGVYNYKKPGPLQNYFSFVAENHDTLEGDVVELGVFRGRALLGMALMLKELGSKKKVVGYDTFEGFPPVYHDFDHLSKYKELLATGKITQHHYDMVQRNISIRQLELKNEVSSANISTSGDFSSNSMDLIKKKSNFLELDNIELVAGSFNNTLGKGQGPTKILAALFDCDLYESYKVGLPFVWSRLTQGGYIYLDEYFSLKFPGAKIATDEFFADKKDRPQCHQKAIGDFERWYVKKILTK